MKILIVGSGGREHALVWKISQSKRVNKIFAAPGNPGMKQLADLVDIKPTSIIELADFAQEREDRPDRGRAGAAAGPGHRR